MTSASTCTVSRISMTTRSRGSIGGEFAEKRIAGAVHERAASDAQPVDAGEQRAIERGGARDRGEALMGNSRRRESRVQFTIARHPGIIRSMPKINALSRVAAQAWSGC